MVQALQAFVETKCSPQITLALLLVKSLLAGGIKLALAQSSLTGYMQCFAESPGHNLGLVKTSLQEAFTMQWHGYQHLW